MHFTLNRRYRILSNIKVCTRLNVNVYPPVQAEPWHLRKRNLSQPVWQLPVQLPAGLSSGTNWRLPGTNPFTHHLNVH